MFKNLESAFPYAKSARESDEWDVAHATNLEEENKSIGIGFEYIRYSKKDQVAIYRKRK